MGCFVTYVDQVEKELLEKCEDIPFGNSLYQDESFILNTSYTDARAVRNIGLTLSARVRALRELEFSMRKMGVDLREIEHKLKSAHYFEKERLEIEREEKTSGMAYTQKLLKDALYEVEYLRAILAKLPKLTRAEFEGQEKAYFIESLSRQATNLPESVKSLEAMGVQPEQEYKFFNKQTLSERLGVTVDKALPSEASVLATRQLAEKQG